MKKKIVLSTLMLLIATLVSCNGQQEDISSSKESDKTPVYQGMTVNRLSSLSSSKSANKMLKKDISDIVNPTSPVDSTIRYYVNPSETFRLHVSLTNPGKYEIQSLTLNGKKYASYMFADGSDLENIYIEMQAPDQSGYQDYTLEGMKYLDNTSIKDIVVGENNSLSVGVRYTDSPVASIHSLSVTATSYSCEIQVDDQDKLIKDDSLYFYVTDGDSIINKTPLENGTNKITLDKLSCGNTYQVGVLGQLDLADGRGQHAEWLTKEEFETDDIFTFDNLFTNENSVSFDLVKNYSLEAEVSQVDLEKEGLVVSSLKKTDDYRFSNLLSDSKYDLAIHYSFQDEKDNVVRTSFKTKSYELPSYTISLVNADYDSLTISVASVDKADLGSTYTLNLYDEQGKTYVAVCDGDEYVFENLNSNTKYIAYVTYNYDAHDGKGETRKFVQQEFTTLSYDHPTIIEDKKDIQCNSIMVTYSLSNPLLGTIDSVSLYKDGDLISLQKGNEVTFTGLESGHDYTAEISYSYDLKDGKGIRTDIVEKTYHTNAQLSISEITSLNPSQEYVAGDIVSLKAKLDNPNNLTIKSLSVNGKSVSFTIIGSYLCIEYTIENGTFSAGDNYLYIDALTASETINYSTKTYSYSFKQSSNNQFAFKYYSTPYMSEATSENDLDYYTIGDDCVYELDIKDITSQEITSVTMKDGTEFTVKKGDDGKYRVYLPTTESGLKSYKISSVNYTENNNAESMDYNQIIQYYVLPSETAISITSIDEFMAMESGKTYSLDADLDFNDVTYVPFAFDGVLRGNGHVIKNLRLTVPSTATSGTYYGLFTSAKGFIDQIVLDNFYFENDVSNVSKLYMGLLAGSSENLCLRNVEVKDTCMMKINGNGNDYAGVLLGLAENNVLIEDCVTSCVVWETSSKLYYGGFIGRMYSSAGGYASFHRNESSNTFACSASKMAENYALYASNYQLDVDVSDMLVATDYGTTNQYYSSYLLDMNSNSNVYINHYVDLSSRYVSKCYAQNVGEISNSCLLMNVNIPVLDGGSASSYKKKKNLYINDSYYNGETDEVLALEDVSTYYDIMGFDKDTWTFDDVPYSAKSNIGTTSNPTYAVSFKKPVLNLKK